MATQISPVALVTGASRGIGRAAALALSARGMRVALHYHRNETAARATLAELTGSDHAIFRADVSGAMACSTLVDEVQARYGQIDVLVNNAGIYEEHDPLKVDFAAWQQTWQRTISANLDGPAHLAFLAAQHMCARGTGRIINITSRGAFRGEPTAPAYGAAKAGLNAFGQSLAKALAPENIFVYTIAPGWVATDMATAHLSGPGGPDVLAQHPLGRVATPEEIANAIAWLALDAPAAMTGAILDINGASYLRT